MAKQGHTGRGLLVAKRKSVWVSSVIGAAIIAVIVSIYLLRIAPAVHADAINTTDFVTTWRVPADSTTVTIPTTGGAGYDYNVDWNNDGIPDDTGVTGNITHDYGTAGEYTIRISGTFPQFCYSCLPYGTSSEIIDVNQWGISQWRSMNSAFRGATGVTAFSATDTPDLRNVIDMSYMFNGASNFNGNVSSWDTSSVTNMTGIFRGARSFNQPLNDWSVGNVTDMTDAFYDAIAFNRPLNKWDVSNVVYMEGMFGGDYYNPEPTSFNQNLNDWDVSSVVSMRGMFGGNASFNQDLNSWDVSDVVDMNDMFGDNDIFNGDISEWDVSNVEDMTYMFGYNTAFNGDLSKWDTSGLTSAGEMFEGATSFNSDLSKWDTSSLKWCPMMFYEAKSFNSNLSNWDVSQVRNAWGMFYGATNFKSDVSGWQMSDNNSSYAGLFTGASSFTSNLGSWDMSVMKESWDIGNMLANSGMTRPDYDATLAGWAAQKPQTPQEIDVTGLKYCQTADRDELINTYGWTITGDTQDCTPIAADAEVKSGSTDLPNHPTIPKRPTFSGVAEPFATVTVTVHSDPISCTTTADISGKWSCTLPTDLEPGEHTAYVVVTLPNAGGTQNLGPYAVTVASDGSSAPITDDTDPIPGVPNTAAGVVGMLYTKSGAIMLSVGVLTLVGLGLGARAWARR